MTRPEVPLGKPGSVLKEYPKGRASDLANKWLDVFGKQRQGVNSKAFMWHVFSAGRYPCLEGEAARAAYAQQSAPEYIILSNDRAVAFLTDHRPEFCRPCDYLVFPPNLAWTMAFTHEEGLLGPYFAQHENFTALDAQNKASIRKAREIELARHKGWL